MDTRFFRVEEQKSRLVMSFWKLWFLAPFKEKVKKNHIVAYPCNLNNGEAEAWELLNFQAKSDLNCSWVPGQSGLHSNPVS